MVLLGEELTTTISAFDDIIQYGQDKISGLENEVQNARQVANEIQAMRNKFKNTLLTRIEQIVRDVRVALDDQSMVLLSDVDKKVAEMEANAQSVITTSRVKLDTANTFLAKAAVTLPNENGEFEEEQLIDVYQHYSTLQKVTAQSNKEVKSVPVNVRFPNTMKVKSECRDLAKRIIGEIENTKRPNLLDAQRPSIDVTNIKDFN